MVEAIQFPCEHASNLVRRSIAEMEPKGLRTYTPSLAVIERSAGLFHWTSDGRKLADFTSGVLVTNLGHTPRRWLARWTEYLGMTSDFLNTGDDYVPLPTFTAYNAISTLENQANERLLASLRQSTFGRRLEQVMWSASGSEGIQKALWAALAFQPDRDIILATRDGFHGKKGLAGAVTGNEQSPDRDPRVQFLSFPKTECQDQSLRAEPIDLTPYRNELEQLRQRFGRRLNCLITEPYLGGGGSYHPHPEYLQLLVQFCRDNDMVFILDEVQSNFGRTGSLYAFETYQIEPDIVVLGKGMGNGVPVNAAVGRADVLGSLGYGGASDTWSGHPLGCAATLATLDIFETEPILASAKIVAKQIESALFELKSTGIVSAVRGEGHVWGIEMAGTAQRSREEVAVDVVRAAYLGDDQGRAIHLLGPLAGYVLRISPPLTMTPAEAEIYLPALKNIVEKVASQTMGP